VKKQIGQTWLHLIQGDITEQDTDAIVNAANSMLKHGGGVAGAILKKGGHTIQEESDLWVKVWGGRVDVGSCAITSAGNLPARYVIHAVGPRMGEGDEDEKLKKATLSSLGMAEKRNFNSITFPAISTGIFGYPMDRCADIMLSTVMEYVKQSTTLKKIVFCLYDQDALKVFEESLTQLTSEPG